MKDHLRIYSIYGVLLNKEGILVKLEEEAQKYWVLFSIVKVILLPFVIIIVFLIYYLLTLLGYENTVLCLLIFVPFLVGLYFLHYISGMLEAIKLVSLTEEDRHKFIKLFAKESVEAELKLKAFCSKLQKMCIKF